ncbi:MAG: hypothetical protein RB191_07425 [Terriglobia bacterium]|nr:hypothetical protein [Terriglobia bacterium]
MECSPDLVHFSIGLLNRVSQDQIAHVDMCLTGTLAKWRGRFSVAVVSALIAVAKQLHLHLFHLLGIVHPNLSDERVLGVTEGVESDIVMGAA